MPSTLQPLHPKSPKLFFEIRTRTLLYNTEKAEEAQKEEGVVSVLPKIIKSAFTLVHLIYFFTAGPDEVRAWVCRKGSKAPQAAGTIHSDFEQGFICAEVK